MVVWRAKSLGLHSPIRLEARLKFCFAKSAMMNLVVSKNIFPPQLACDEFNQLVQYLPCKADLPMSPETFSVEVVFKRVPEDAVLDAIYI